MRVDDFDFELPQECIAQHPAERREQARLMLLDRESGSIAHHRFADLPDLLRASDLLVLNDTRVTPARLLGRKPSGGRVELLLLEPGGGPGEWLCWMRASHPPGAGGSILFDGGLLAEVVAREGDRTRVRLHAADGDLVGAIERIGQVPLPPYIHRDEGRSTPADRERYQTVYAREPGAVAAPTAGLHFTRELLAEIAQRGVAIETLTLHVGPATFQPVRAENVEDHPLAGERFVLSESVANAVRDARRRGGRVLAVGTTVVRTLESRAHEDGGVEPGSGECTLFVVPGHRFRIVDALVTNFHLPRSTLLMLVSAFAGRERLLCAYREAVRGGYRFYSYGDAMLIA